MHKRKNGAPLSARTVLALDQRPSPYATLAGLVIAGLLTGAGAIITFSERDQVAPMPGRLTPTGQIKTIKPMIGGRVEAIHVADGERVKKGQLLLTFEPIEHEAERARLAGEYRAERVKLLRLNATVGTLRQPHDLSVLARAVREKVDRALKLWQVKDGDPNLAAGPLESLQLVDELTAYAAQFGQIRAEIFEAETERDGLQKTLIERTRRVGHMAERVAMIERLLESGTASRARYLEQLDNLAKNRTEMVYDAARIESIGARLARLDVSATASRSEIIRKLGRERAESAVRMASLLERVRQAESREQSQRLYAPAAGVVEQLNVHTIGDVIPTATQVMVIVPNQHLEVEALLSTKSGEVQDVRVKVIAFDYQRYGSVTGTVRHIAKDAVKFESGGGEAWLYPVRITISKQALTLRGRSAPLVAGMTVQADAKTGTRPLYEILFKPIRTVIDEAMREP